ncbi:MAG: VTT domain-containing protein [Bacilli bacterium]|nr:VTT domain-containing protein [Bacilli bacterium]
MKRQKLFILILSIIIVTLLFFFFKNTLFEILKFQSEGNLDAVAELVKEKGVLGCLTIIVVEALQMVVVFISAEFIQIAAGISYPWYMALPLCSIGILIGATIIYFLVNSLKFDSSMFKKSYQQISQYSKKNVNTQILMYVLFVMPIIPFGAICYYGSSSKISYRRYIFTCLTGTIPSILSSIFLSKAISYTIINDTPIWILILVIIGVMAILLAGGIVLFNKVLFKGEKNTPDSFLYPVLIKIAKALACFKSKPRFNAEGLEEVEGPFVLLSNHPSAFDVYYASELVYPIRLAHVSNRYYFRKKFLRRLFNKIGAIPKMLFNPDFETIKKTLTMIKKGYPIFMCPEGRLGLDGTNYYITKETGKFVKQLKLPIVIVKIEGAYLSDPKWRKHRIKNKVLVSISKILTKEEVLSKTPDEINDIINKYISYNDFEFAKEHNLIYRNNKKAEGLENVLYHCPKCHEEFHIKTKGNKIYCEHCGFSLNILDNYSFEENDLNISNIHEWYQSIIKYEKEQLIKGINLSCDVKIKKFNMKDSKLDEEGSGKCYLTESGFKYEGDLRVKSFEIDSNNLRGFAFSCGEEFECYYDNELYYFYPLYNKEQCCKWALIVDELVKENEK